MQEPIDDLSEKEQSIHLKMVDWWEKKRYLYNIILIVFLILILTSLRGYYGFMLSVQAAIIQAIGFVIFGNIFYTIGWAGGILRHYYYSSYPLSYTGRWVLFVLGCLFSIVMIYFHYIFATDVIFAH